MSWTYKSISVISELKSRGGMEPESWFSFKWLRIHQTSVMLMQYAVAEYPNQNFSLFHS